MSLAATPAVTLLRHIASGDAAALREHVSAHPPTLDHARWLLNQLLAPYAFHQLKAAGALPSLPPEVRDFLQKSHRTMALHEAVVAEAAQAVLVALAEAHVESVAMKGWALAYRAYPTPRCRPMGDLDLWVRGDARLDAIAVVEGLGYRELEKEDRPAEMAWALEGEWQMSGPEPARLLIELQWPAFRGEWVRRATRIDHDGIWARSEPTTIEGVPVRLMSAEDTLLLLAVHQGINHHFSYPCWLRTQVDIHQLVRGGITWGALAERARAWGVATVAWLSLTLAAELLGTPVPPGTLAALAPPRAQRAALARFDVVRSVVEMRPVQYDRRRLFLQFLLSDSPRAMARLVYRAFFPEAEWLRLRYELTSSRQLPLARLRHLRSLLFKGRV